MRIHVFPYLYLLDALTLLMTLTLTFYELVPPARFWLGPSCSVDVCELRTDFTILKKSDLIMTM